MDKSPHTLDDSNVFPYPQYARPAVFTARSTVKAIVLNDDGKIGLVTNDTHKLCLLPGGGVEIGSLEDEIWRECQEELGCDIEDVRRLDAIKEFRYRDASEYLTTCFVATAHPLAELTDRRTADEQTHNLHPVWLSLEEARSVLKAQQVLAKNGTIPFYNTSFNTVRDWFFLEMYFERSRDK